MACRNVSTYYEDCGHIHTKVLHHTILQEDGTAQFTCPQYHTNLMKAYMHSISHPEENGRSLKYVQMNDDTDTSLCTETTRVPRVKPRKCGDCAELEVELVSCNIEAQKDEVRAKFNLERVLPEVHGLRSKLWHERQAQYHASKPEQQLVKRMEEREAEWTRDAMNYVINTRRPFHIFCRQNDCGVMKIFDPKNIADGEKVCTICQEKLAENATPSSSSDSNAKALRKLFCGHNFHLDCIAPWFLREQNCPLCRNSLNCPIVAIPSFADPIYQIIPEARPNLQQTGGFVPFTAENMGPWFGHEGGKRLRLTTDGVDVKVNETKKDELTVLRLIQDSSRSSGRRSEQRFAMLVDRLLDGS